MGSCRGASPSPSGRGWPEGPGEGRLVKNVAHSGPHPPLRGTLSRRERDSLQPLPTTANVQTPGTQRGARTVETRPAVRFRRSYINNLDTSAPGEGGAKRRMRASWRNVYPSLPSPAVSVVVYRLL